MADKSRKPEERSDDKAWQFSLNGPPRSNGPVMEGSGQKTPNAKAQSQVSPPPPPKKPER